MGLIRKGCRLVVQGRGGRVRALLIQLFFPSFFRGLSVVVVVVVVARGYEAETLITDSHAITLHPVYGTVVLVARGGGTRRGLLLHVFKTNSALPLTRFGWRRWRVTVMEGVFGFHLKGGMKLVGVLYGWSFPGFFFPSTFFFADPGFGSTCST
jgi:hypothetical protein